LKILLIQSPSVTDIGAVYPLGLLYVATGLTNRNHEIQVFDTNIGREPQVRLRELIHKFKPDIFGVSFRNIGNVDYFKYHSYLAPFSELVAAVKEISPTYRIVAGGSAFSLYAQTLMERIPNLDYGIFNEGEESLPELLASLDHPEGVKGVFYRNKESVRFTGYRQPIDFASFPMPKRDLIDMEPYLKNELTIGIQTKRGCLFECSYCTYPYFQGNKLRIRPSVSVIDELEILSKQYGVKSVYFVDTVFNVPKVEAREIIEAILSRGLDLKWRGFNHLKYIDEEYMRTARDSGCDFFEFSPDGINQSTLTALNKNITRADIERVYSIARKTDNTKTSFLFAINGPGENLTSLFNLAWFGLRPMLLRHKNISGSDVFRIRIFPHTQLQNIALSKGLLRADNDLLGPVFYNPPPLKYILAVILPSLNIIYSTLVFMVRQGRRIKAFLGRFH
jgi:anaerobic magnesium-protoporphyrin IX monomethyl ester cyclase